MSEWGHAALGLAAVAGLIGGAEKAVRHAVALMRETGLSGSFVGLTVMSVGTSLPELATHVVASVQVVTSRRALDVASGTTLGMNVGSDIVQQNLLIGLVALVGAITVTDSFLRRDFVALVVAASSLWLFALDGVVARGEGGMLILGYLAYLALVYRQRRRGEQDDEARDVETARDTGVYPLWGRVAWIAGGLGVVVGCGELILREVEHFTARFGIGDSLIGVAVLGLATALPELSTALTSLGKKQGALSIGTLVGSNVTNPTLAVGAGAAISTYVVPSSVLGYDLPVKVGTAVLLLGLFARDRRLSKTEATTMMASYFVYLGVRFWLYPGPDVYPG